MERKRAADLVSQADVPELLLLLLERIIVDDGLIKQPLKVSLLLHLYCSYEVLQVNDVVVLQLYSMFLYILLDHLNTVLNPPSIVGKDLVDCHDVWKHVKA